MNAAVLSGRVSPSRKFQRMRRENSPATSRDSWSSRARSLAESSRSRESGNPSFRFADAFRASQVLQKLQEVAPQHVALPELPPSGQKPTLARVAWSGPIPIFFVGKKI